MVEDYDEVTNKFAFLMDFLAVYGTMAKSIFFAQFQTANESNIH